MTLLPPPAPSRRPDQDLRTRPQERAGIYGPPVPGPYGPVAVSLKAASIEQRDPELFMFGCAFRRAVG